MDGDRVAGTAPTNRETVARGLERFLEEARAIRRFRHSNVVQAQPDIWKPGAVSPSSKPFCKPRAAEERRSRSGGRPPSGAVDAGTEPRRPAVSCTAEIGTTPLRLARPTVGLIPTSPFANERQTIEPSVSAPTAVAQRFADAAAPDRSSNRTDCG